MTPHAEAAAADWKESEKRVEHDAATPPGTMAAGRRQPSTTIHPTKRLNHGQPPYSTSPTCTTASSASPFASPTSPPPGLSSAKPSLLPTSKKQTKKQTKKSVSDRNISKVVLGDLLFDTWYGSLYPEQLLRENCRRELDRLYVCPSCFRYAREVMPYLGHLRACTFKRLTPPGRPVYKKRPYSIYEVDGEENRLFCQNLSLFAKLFLENKSVCFDLSAFNYYILVLHTQDNGVRKRSSSRISDDGADHLPGNRAYQVIGFFSKEKMSWDNNNVACILVFPPWQRKGLGKILMGVSYELSRREGRVGGPEKPLSTLGKRGYLSFWSATIARYILSYPAKRRISVQNISEDTFILPADVVAALKDMDVLSPAPPGRTSALSSLPSSQHAKDASGSSVVNKARVREWAATNRVDSMPVVSSEDFVPDWDARASDDNVEDDDDEDDENDEEDDDDEEDEDDEYEG
ncbi:MAG: hypothetical protein M1815_000532 [Lichina confinis]|nr:MAG: hypothetical protein M1815_000532 [Lichina confinis]